LHTVGDNFKSIEWAFVVHWYTHWFAILGQAASESGQLGFKRLERLNPYEYTYGLIVGPVSFVFGYICLMDASSAT
jgi:hypothetical protein